MQEIFVGADVAKDWLDIHHPGRGARRIENTPRAVRAFARSSARQGDGIIFEASGGYDRLLREALEVAAVRFTRVNPRQARDFARAMGVIGKTDRVMRACSRNSAPASDQRRPCRWRRRDALSRRRCQSAFKRDPRLECAP